MNSVLAEFNPTSCRPGLQELLLTVLTTPCTPDLMQLRNAISNKINGLWRPSTFACIWPKRILGLTSCSQTTVRMGMIAPLTGEPELFTWQQESSNVLLHLHPPRHHGDPVLKKLAKTRGSSAPGSVPADTVIMFAMEGTHTP